MEDEKKGLDNSNDEKAVLKNHAVDGHSVEALSADVTSGFGNDSTVKFINGDKDPELTIASNELATDEFVGLKKEELLKYANDPYWVRVRIVLLVLFGLGWVAMLAAAIAIIVVAPKCPPQPNLDWWQKSIIYHIHPQSFLDTNADQFGDINGIHEKISYLRDNLDVGAVCIGPMNPSPNFEYGYNIANYNVICPHHYGTAADLENLRIALHKNGIRLLLDFIPNHTSRKHPWFKESSKPGNVSASCQDYYIWHPGKTDASGNKLPPNNWTSVYGGSAWTFNNDRKQFYYHTFSEDEPDLNLRNPAVVAELDASLMYWLKKEVDGFRFYGVQYLVEPLVADSETTTSEGFGDMPVVKPPFQTESYELVAHWRELLDNYSKNDGKAKSRYFPRLMIAEVNSPANRTAGFMMRGEQQGAQIATNAVLTKIKRGCGAQCIYDLVMEWTVSATSANLWSNWQLGNLDVSRVVSRMNDSRYVSALNMLLLTLPGTPIVYYGEEIGMKDVKLNYNPCRNLGISQDYCPLAQRSPMQWSDEKFAGFTGGNQTWLNVSDNYVSVNVEAQLAHGAGIGPISIFSKVAKLRGKEPSFLWGKFYPAVSGNVFYFVRQAEGFSGYLVAVNVGTEPSTVNFAENLHESVYLPNEVKVAVSTGHFDGPGRTEAFQEDVVVKLSDRVYLEAGEGVVFGWKPLAHDI
jgi:glycosidase